MRRPRQDGMTLIEVLISLSILSVTSIAAASHLAFSWRSAEQNRDRVFAYEKALSMLEELRAFSQTEEIQEASELDMFDDGAGHDFSLTTIRRAAPQEDQFLPPDAPVSGNVWSEDRWRFARRITVRHFPGIDTRDLRIVTVRIFLNAHAETIPGQEIASVSSVIRTIADAQPSTQVYDVYLLALENVPGWWVYMDTIKPFIEGSLDDLAARNPGLEFRTHWITKLAYGRNPQYTPFFNEKTSSTDDINKVYFYPSKMPEGSAAVRYYVPDRVQARIDVDGAVMNTFDDTTNPWPYTLADQYNHCMRLPDEEALFQQRVEAGLEDPDEPTWRLFLETLNTDPDRFHNAILVNLHGELLPLPPLRNYSDAARVPDRKPGVRVVTHPEKLRFERGLTVDSSEDIRLRVYTYKMDPGVGDEILDVPVIVEIPGADLTDNVNGLGVGDLTLEVRRVVGGLDLNPVDGNRDDYVDPDTAAGLAPVALGTAPYAPAFPGEMYARVRLVDPGAGFPPTTLLELYGSPLITPVVDNRGLANSRRLYGMEYIPCSTEAANDFSTDLFTSGTVEKNTARWVITVPAESLPLNDLRADVVTRIGNGDGTPFVPDSAAFGTGIMYPPLARNEPENMSRTFTWYAEDPEAVPATERYQFQGDPRHCPYADLKNNGSSFANGYNWYFDDFQSSSGNAMSRWPGFSSSRLKNNSSNSDDGWERRAEVDVPRFMQMLRGGLHNSESLWTTLTGWSYYYMGIGNEIGYDSANGFPSSIPVSGLPFGDPNPGYEQAITTSASTWGSGVKLVRSNQGGNYWWGMPWLGELYPDSAYDQYWKVPTYEYGDVLPLPAPLPSPKGNLPAGVATGDFRRTPRESITTRLPYGTKFERRERRLQREGCTSFFNVGNSSATFHHRGKSNTTGDLTVAGSEIATDFRFPLPGNTAISRPFELASNGDGGVGDEFSYTSEFPRFSVNNRKTYYTHSSGAVGSALVELTRTGTGRSAFVLVSGLDKTTESGSAFIARYSVLTLVHGFLHAGDPALPNPFPQRPRLLITTPTAITELDDPTSIDISWHTEPRRWDGEKYTADYPDNYADAETNFEYVLLYSLDNGRNWLHMIDDSEATPGVLPGFSGLRLDDQSVGDETFTWMVPPNRFPVGTYKIRVKCYRTGSRLHYSYHEEKVFINR